MTKSKKIILAVIIVCFLALLSILETDFPIHIKAPSKDKDLIETIIDPSLYNQSAKASEPRDDKDFAFLGITEEGEVVKFNNNEDLTYAYVLRDYGEIRQGNIQVDENKIIYVNNDGHLISYNTSDKSYTTVYVPDRKLVDDGGSAMINNFLLTDNYLFYLYGNNCNGYRDHCSLEFKSFNLKDSSTRSITTEAREILSFDYEKNKIYLAYTEGDAGCMYGKVSEIDLETFTLLSRFSFSGCFPGGEGFSDDMISIEYDDGYIRYKKLLEDKDTYRGYAYSSNYNKESVSEAERILFTATQEGIDEIIYFK